MAGLLKKLISRISLEAGLDPAFDPNEEYENENKKPNQPIDDWTPPGMTSVKIYSKSSKKVQLNGKTSNHHRGGWVICDSRPRAHPSLGSPAAKEAGLQSLDSCLLHRAARILTGKLVQNHE